MLLVCPPLFSSFFFCIFHYMTEIWREVEGYKDYLISNCNGWKNISRNTQPKGRIVNGYRAVTLGRKEREISYHVLVAKAFPEICGEWFEGCQVHHKNFDKLDNRPENLVVLSAEEHLKLHYNMLPESFRKASEKRSAAISKALKGKTREDKHIPIIQLTRDGELVKRWNYISEVKEAGYDPSNVCSVCRGKMTSAYGFLWRYAD